MHLSSISKDCRLDLLRRQEEDRTCILCVFQWPHTFKLGMKRLSFSTTSRSAAPAFRMDRVNPPGPGPTSHTWAFFKQPAWRTILSVIGNLCLSCHVYSEVQWNILPNYSMRGCHISRQKDMPVFIGLMVIVSASVHSTVCMSLRQFQCRWWIIF